MSYIPPVIGEALIDITRHISGSRGPTPSERRDVHDIARCVARYARGLGCTESNISAAVAFALRHGTDTLACIGIGYQRADKLAHLQRHTTPPSAA